MKTKADNEERYIRKLRHQKEMQEYEEKFRELNQI